MFMKNCQYCNKVFKDGGIATHQAFCRLNPNKNIPSSNHGGYRKGSGRGLKGWYKGIFCDSSWELAYILYCEYHKIEVKRYDREKLFYTSIDGETHEYIPDFIINNEIVIEIKGYETEISDIKKYSFPYITVLTKYEMIEILDQVKSIYGDNFVSLYNDITPVKKERKLVKPKLPPKEKRIVQIHSLTCKSCGVIFERMQEHRDQQFCSQTCAKKSQQKFEISKDELSEMIWKYPASTLSKMYGVSDKAIEKRCKKYNISKPQRGYWSKHR